MGGKKRPFGAGLWGDVSDTGISLLEPVLLLDVSLPGLCPYCGSSASVLGDESPAREPSGRRSPGAGRRGAVAAGAATVAMLPSAPPCSQPRTSCTVRPRPRHRGLAAWVPGGHPSLPMHSQRGAQHTDGLDSALARLVPMLRGGYSVLLGGTADIALLPFPKPF